MNPPSRGLSRSITRGGGHWPHVHDAGTLRQAVGGQVGQREGRKSAYPEAFVFPGQHVVCQVDFLMDHRELDLGVLTGHHLRGNDMQSLSKAFHLTCANWNKNAVKCKRAQEAGRREMLVAQTSSARFELSTTSKKPPERAWWRQCFWWDILYIKFWRSYHFQLFEKRILRSSLFWWFGHVKVQRVPIPHSVQTQHKSNIVLQQTGVWKGEYNKAFIDSDIFVLNFTESCHKQNPAVWIASVNTVVG